MDWESYRSLRVASLAVHVATWTNCHEKREKLILDERCFLLFPHLFFLRSNYTGAHLSAAAIYSTLQGSETSKAHGDILPYMKIKHTDWRECHMMTWRGYFKNTVLSSSMDTATRNGLKPCFRKPLSSPVAQEVAVIFFCAFVLKPQSNQKWNQNCFSRCV